MRSRRLTLGLLMTAALISAACGAPPRREVVDSGVVVDAGFNTKYFELTASQPSIVVGQGGVSSLNLTVKRTSETGTIAFSVAGLPPGVTGTFVPPTTDAEGTVMTLAATAMAALDGGVLDVIGTGPASKTLLKLPISVTLPARVLLVDDDRSENNRLEGNPKASASDTLYRALFTELGVTFNVFVVPTNANGPTLEQLRGYETVVWYCGDATGGEANVNTVSLTDEETLKSYLDLGNKKVAIFSAAYLAGQPAANVWLSTTGEWLQQYVGAGGLARNRLNDNSYAVTGAYAMLGVNMAVLNGLPIRTLTNPINPAAGTDTFFTAALDPNDSHAFPQTPIAVGRRGIGSARSSKVLVFSFSFENLGDQSSPSRKVDAMSRVLGY